MGKTKRLGKVVSFLAFAFCMTMLLSVHTKAADEMAGIFSDVYVTGVFEDETLKDRKVSCQPLDGGNYGLFLPSTADLNDLTLHFTADVDGAYVMINDQKFYDGQKISLKEGNDSLQIAASHMFMPVTVKKSANLAAMLINTESGTLDQIHASKENKEKGDMLLVRADGTVDYNSTLKHIKGRGNSTWTDFPKKPYNIKLDNSANLLGMGKAKGWCLLANFADHSFLRDQILYDLADEVGIPFTMACKSLDLYINGRYMGIYLMTEKIEVDKNRVNITDLEKATEKANTAKLDTYGAMGTKKAQVNTKKWIDIPNDPEDITGGYLIEMELHDRYADEACGFVTTGGQAVTMKCPEYVSKAQIDYISKFYQEMEDALYSENGKNKLGKHYTEYIDEESLARMYLIQEFSLNLDSGITSFYLYKDSDLAGDGKLHAAPVWDFDMALGNNGTRTDALGNRVNFQNPEAWWAKNAALHDRGYGDRYNVMARATKHEGVWKKVVELWNEEYMPAIKVILGETTSYQPKVLRSLDSYASEITTAEKMNDLLWTGWYGCETNWWTEMPTGYSFSDNIQYLRQFMTTRRNFMDQSLAYGSSGYQKMTGEVKIEGTMKVGETLTATVTGSNASGNLSYQWLADGVKIEGAVEPVYVLTKEDAGKVISVSVSCDDAKIAASVSGTGMGKVEEEKPVDPVNPDPIHPDPIKPINPDDPQIPPVQDAVTLKAPAVNSVVSKKDGVLVTYERVENAVSYEIYRKAGSNYTKIGTTKELSFTDKNPVGGKAVSYVVKAVSGDTSKFITSGYGQEKSIALPKAPAKWKAKRVKGKKAVSLSWKKVKGASSYLIYRSEKKDGVYKQIGKAKKKAVRYTDKKKLKKKKTYFYKISVLKNGAYSPMSKAVKVVMK